MDLGQRFLSAGHVLVSDKRLLVEHIKHYSLQEVLLTDFWRAGALTKILLRRKIANRGKKQRYYASVPWYFALGVPLSWLAVLFAVLAPCLGSGAPAGRAQLCRDLLLNAPFLGFLRRQRGWLFFVQSCLFLLPDMVVSGLGIACSLPAFARGSRY